jgi:hypothetical protein
MKYFTPELLARYGSPDDQVADAANAEWEAVTERYQKHLRAIEQRLPRKLRALHRRYYLHDAAVLFVGIADQVLHLTLQLDAPPKKTVFLRYRLVSEVQVTTHPHADQEAAQPLTWLYDEIDIARGGAFPVIEQWILFSNGRELTIHFQDLAYSTAEPLPLMANGVDGRVRAELTG